MANSSALIRAAQDADLRQRAIALAAELGMDNPEAWVDSQLYQLAAAPVTNSGDTVASVHEFASAQYEQAVAALPPRPGLNPAVVTDDFLRFALTKLAEGQASA